MTTSDTGTFTLLSDIDFIYPYSHSHINMKAAILAAAGVLSTAIAGPVVEKRQSTVSNPKTPPVSVKGNGELIDKKRPLPS